MGGGEPPSMQQQLGVTSREQTDRMPDGRVKQLEKQVEDLQARLNEANAKYAKLDEENLRLHRALLTEIEERHSLQKQLKSGPCGATETAPAAGQKRRAAPRQGLFAARGPLFEEDPLEGRTECPFPEGRNAGLDLGLGAGLGIGLSTGLGGGLGGLTQGRGSQAPESLILTPPQDVPVRRERAGVARRLDRTFEGTGTAGGLGLTQGLNQGLSQGMLERLSQESDEREEFLGSGNRPAVGGRAETPNGNRHPVGGATGAANGEVSGQTQFGGLGANGRITDGIASTNGIANGVKVEDVRGGAIGIGNVGAPFAGQVLNGGVGNGSGAGLGVGLANGLGAGAAAGFGSAFDPGAQSTAGLQDDQDSVGTQVVEEGADNEVTGHWGGAFQGNPPLESAGGRGQNDDPISRAQYYEPTNQPQNYEPINRAPTNAPLAQAYGNPSYAVPGGQNQQHQGGGGPGQTWQNGAQGYVAPPQVQGDAAGGVSGGGQVADPESCFKCGSDRVIELTAKKGQHSGKRFYKCEACGKFLKWKDAVAAAPGTPPRATAQLSPGPHAAVTGAFSPPGSFSPPGRGQKRPWGGQQGPRGACPQCGGLEVTEHITGKEGPNKGKWYLKCANAQCNKWLRWKNQL